VPRILLADDSTHAQRMGVKILSAEGFEVTTVSNGKAAIDSFKKSIPDMVVADVFMPGRNGYEVCQHVKTSEELKNIPVLLIIGAMEPYDPDEGKKAGADGVITKPLESSNLLATVKGLLEAAKHFAPAKPQPKKEKPKAEDVVEAPDPAYAPVQEDPSWAQDEEVITTNPRQEEIVIPHAIKEQPVGMLTELLDAPEPHVSSATPLEEAPLPEIPVAVPDIPSIELNMPSAAAVEEPAAKSSLPTWVAQEAEVTAEDEALFASPASAAPSWSELTQMAAAVSEEPAALPNLPWQMEPDLVRSDETPVDAGTAEGIEHFENLNETISSYAPISPAALGIGIEPIPLTPVEEAVSAAMPSFNEEIILSPADVAAGASPETISGPIDPNFDRGFEPITSSFPIPQPVEEPIAEPAPEVVAAVEELVDAAPAAASEDDRLVEAAVAMVREATERELDADAAASPDKAAPAVDPATLEHVIRGVVGELMPQIVSQVKSALKN
jgi:CheY-like chemotaxis protein